MTNEEYKRLVDKHTKKDNKIINAMVTFFGGGLMGLFSELLLNVYKIFLSIPRKEAGVMVILTLIVIASF